MLDKIFGFSLIALASGCLFLMLSGFFGEWNVLYNVPQTIIGFCGLAGGWIPIFLIYVIIQFIVDIRNTGNVSSNDN